jgi:deoxycytidine triphosphate deaminase
MIVIDRDLQILIERHDNPLLTGFDRPSDWQDNESLVQPCSLDLHIGAIYQPGIKAGNQGSAANPKHELVLKTGQTAIVGTEESIHLPSDYAAFGFPPSSNVSERALLMTNPGHIDPGFEGKLHFTVINMGREDFVLRKTDQIVTLLVFKLDSAVAADFARRHPKPPGQQPGDPIKRLQSNIDRLAPDFVDVQRRATGIVRKELRNASAIASVLGVILGWAFTQVDRHFNNLEDIQTKLSQVQSANAGLTKELQSTKEQLEKQMEFERRLTIVEAQGAAKRTAK